MISNKYLKIILFPITCLYAGITFLRNKLYDYKILNTYKPTIYTINIGNLAVGGTGKTPHVEYLANRLSDKYNIAILSRGYGRKTKGFLEATQNTNAKIVGDEPFQYFLKFKEKLHVFVCENRVLGFKNIMNEYPKTKLLILDDAFQHRSILPDLNILLTEFGNLFTADFILPSGNLRESRTNANRADAVIVTKCPNGITHNQIGQINNEIRFLIKKEIPIFYSNIIYGLPIAYFASFEKPRKKIIVVSAIANPKYFQDYCKTNWEVEKCLQYADHHSFNENDVNNLIKENGHDVSFFTTEKDYVKLKDLVPKSFSIFYIPIEINFINQATLSFDSFLNQEILK